MFLKVDWNKWIDEDEEGDDKGGAPPMDYGDFDFSNLNMGGGEDYGAGPADDNDDENDDSDSEEDDSVAKAA
ncbi:hypothetical protein ACMWQU_27575, partial [Escherichia coli]|uniref:hypothetical protein n=1 Tax=Escherichia coli TaxID=562 RepID=UPI0039E08587